MFFSQKKMIQLAQKQKKEKKNGPAVCDALKF